jgi:hypothetical protein
MHCTPYLWRRLIGLRNSEDAEVSAGKKLLILPSRGTFPSVVWFTKQTKLGNGSIRR